jgi:hypothetical protein
MTKSETLINTIDLNLESRLIFLLAYISREHDKTNSIYDVAWGIFTFKSIGRRYEQLYEEAHYVSSLLMKMSPEDLSDFLYDYRRAVGVALFIYLLNEKSLGLSDRRLREICEVLIDHSEKSDIGELIGVTFLLLRHLKYKEMEKSIRNLIDKIKNLAINNPAYYLIDLMYIAFFSAIANDPFYVEVLEIIHKNEQLLAYIKDDPEKLALFLYMISKAVNSEDSSLTEWCKEQRESIAPILMRFVKENYLTSDDYYSLVNDLINAIAGFKTHSLIKEIKNGEAIINLRDIDLRLLRPDLFSKIIIALYEAGYLRPFMLSKKEADIYRQIRAEVKRYRRVRKYELIFIFASLALLILLLPFAIHGLISLDLNISNYLNYLRSYYLYYVLSIVLFLISVCSIWERGYISIRELLKYLENKLPLLKMASN